MIYVNIFCYSIIQGDRKITFFFLPVSVMHLIALLMLISILSNLANAQNVSCLGISDKNIFPKGSA